MENTDADFIDSVLDSDSIESSPFNNELARLTTALQEEPCNNVCSNCEKSFSKTSNLNRHRKKCLEKSKTYICQDCGKTYSKRAFYKQHIKEKTCSSNLTTHKRSSSSSSAKCNKCSKTFTRKFSLERHLERNACNNLQQEFQCRKCNKQFMSAAYLKRHFKNVHGNPTTRPSQVPHPPKKSASATASASAATALSSESEPDMEDEPSQNQGDPEPAHDGDLLQFRRVLFDGNMMRYRLEAVQEETTNMLFFFSNRRSMLTNNLITELGRLRTVKWYVAVKVDMERVNINGEVIDEASPVFRSVTRPLLTTETIDEQINTAYLEMMRNHDAFRESGSGWRQKGVQHMEQTVLKYSPLRGSCYQYKIPENLLRRNSLLNVTGPPELDGHCFEYAVLAALHTDPDLVGHIPWSSLHQYRGSLNFNGIDESGLHMPVSAIQVFETQNNLSVNLYGFEDIVFPIHISKQENVRKHVDLLLLSGHMSDNKDSEDLHFQTIVDHRKPHYCAVKNLNRLVAAQVGRYFTDICRRCLTPRYSEESMNEHTKICSKADHHSVCEMPSEKQRWVKFRNYARVLRVSFVIVANFICYTSPIYSTDEETEGYMNRERKLQPCAYSYQRISVDGSHPKDPVFYKGSDPDDTLDHFLSDMAAEEAEVKQILERIVPTIVCSDGLDNLENSNTVCFVCKYPYGDDERVVVDHNHVSGKIRGRCHNRCNLRLQEAKHLPIVLENLSKYEGRLVMQAVGKFGAECITVVPQTIDTFVSISINRCRYLDFSRFIKSPLDDLVENLREKSGLDKFNFLKKQINPVHIDMCARKHFMFPDYLDYEERLDEKDLPPASAFGDRIDGKVITEDQYTHVKNVWSAFSMESLADYVRFFSVTRSLLFADVLENFRDVLMSDFGLDPMHYYSLPGYSFDCALYKSEVSLELITDADMHHTILQALRGGVTVVGSPRICRANSPDLGDYDKSRPYSKTLFLDFNALYPSCMIDFPLPSRGFHYLTDYEIDRLDIENIPQDNDTGYILVVDLDYPQEIHDRDDQFPMCPENEVVTVDMLSPYTQNLADECGIKLKDEKKLCQTLRDKKRYATHYLTLQHYIKQGMVLKNIHSVIAFTQTFWIQEYMSSTCQKRRDSTNKFDGLIYKNMANQFFGKTIENKLKQINVKICTNPKRLEDLVRKPTFAAARVFSPNLAAVQLYNEKVYLNKPITVGFSVLELSKLKMFQFYHEFLLKKFPEGSVRVLYCDTDSWLLNIKGVEKIEQILEENKEIFDFSSLPDGHSLKQGQNEKVPGKLKLEMGESNIVETVVLTPKCYSILTDNGNKTATKGTNCPLTHDRFRECLENQSCITAHTRTVRNYGQDLFHVKTNSRRVLTPLDTKRFYLSANRSVSYGHYSLK